MNSLLFSSDTLCWKLKNNEIFCPGARRLRFIPFVPRLQSFLYLQSRTVSRVAEKQSSQQSWGCLSHKQKRARARWQLVYDWSISLEYQIYLPAIDTIVTGMPPTTEARLRRGRRVNFDPVPRAGKTPDDLSQWEQSTLRKNERRSRKEG